ncbi:MAG: DUF559 domain-containing protein [Gordonia sp. (in: high G+C Gram-positive bacteria)]|uniref:endonuclease domain-containing protein n=1 Tax=Gordonia sp. (in: high G+C Gram-positive bacteria) TaxID=84139 RepID=UPI003C70E0E8
MQSIPSGVYRYDLLSKEFGRAGLKRLVRDGHATQLRRGWYRLGDPPAEVVTAVQRGGVLSCVSALRHYKVWVPASAGIHVRGNVTAVRTRKGPFCRQFRRPEPEYCAIDDIETALRHAARCLDDESFIVVCDSILNKRLLTFDQLAYQFRDAPKSTQNLLERCDGRAESGTESITRLRLRSKRIPVQIQVQIGDVGRVDLLVGNYLIIEIDGWEYHGDRQHFQSDRERDTRLFSLGYHVLRFTYIDIMENWDVVFATIMNAVRNGVHRRPSQRA